MVHHATPRTDKGRQSARGRPGLAKQTAHAAMRILAISDIHNNVACVRKLRAQEDNSFDVIAIAGDVGGYRAFEIFEVLKSFKCPIV